MRPDPPVRRNGTCAQPGCTKKRPVADLTGKKLAVLVRYAGRRQIEADPFCSAPCARKWHGVDIRENSQTEQRADSRTRGGDTVMSSDPTGST